MGGCFYKIAHNGLWMEQEEEEKEKEECDDEAGNANNDSGIELVDYEYRLVSLLS